MAKKNQVPTALNWKPANKPDATIPTLERVPKIISSQGKPVKIPRANEVVGTVKNHSMKREM